MPFEADIMARQTKAPQQIAAVSIFLPLALLAVVIRIWIRSRMIRSLGWDDVMMVVALVSSERCYRTKLFLITISGKLRHVRFGVDGNREKWRRNPSEKHRATESRDQRKLILLRSLPVLTDLEWTLVAEVFYLTTILFLKVSLGLFFLRVIIKKWLRKIVYATIIISTVINIYHCFFIVFSCGNPKFYLEHTLTKKCVRKSVVVGLAYEQATVTTLTDWIFALLPIPLLWNATMDRRSKLSVGLILSLGAFGSICSLVRFKYIDSLGDRNDFFWNAANVSIWSTIEMGTGIIAGCLATMRPLFKKFMYRAVHLTHAAARGPQPSTKVRLWKGKSSASSSTWHSESSKNFRDWKQSIDTSTGTYTTSCVGGRDLDLENSETLTDHNRLDLVQIREETEFPKEVWSKDPIKSRIWPFAGDDGISKIVDVRVSVSKEQQSFGNSMSWDQRMEDVIQFPQKTRTGSRDTDSIPEWDRLPDLIPPERPGTSGGRSTRSGSRSPALIRITSK
jgi:hypothetical protein